MTTTLSRKLADMGACGEAVLWCRKKTLRKAWESSNRPDWMLWLLGQMEGKAGWPDRKQIVLIACAIAEDVLPIYKKQCPNDSRVRHCIETTRSWTEDKATIEEVQKAAREAARAAAEARAAEAAWAAVRAAWAAAEARAAEAAEAAWAAAEAARAAWAAWAEARAARAAAEAAEAARGAAEAAEAAWAAWAAWAAVRAAEAAWAAAWAAERYADLIRSMVTIPDEL